MLLIKRVCSSTSESVFKVNFELSVYTRTYSLVATSSFQISCGSLTNSKIYWKYVHRIKFSSLTIYKSSSRGVQSMIWITAKNLIDSVTDSVNGFQNREITMDFRGTSLYLVTKFASPSSNSIKS